MQIKKTSARCLGAIISMSVFMAGCASLNSRFDCPMQPGVHCESLDQVNAQVNQGLLGNSSTATRCKRCQATHHATMKPNQWTAPNSSLALATNAPAPVRREATVMRIWIAAFEDKAGNYYQPTTVYTVVKPGFWVGQPVKAVTSIGEEA